MTLEPPGLDPTTGAAAAIGEITHYNIFEGLTKINEDFSVTPLLAEKWTFSPDLKTLTFTLAQGRQVPGRRDVLLEGREILLRARRRQDSTNKDKAFFASIESIDASDPDVVTLKFKAPSFDALFHLGLNTAVIIDEKSAANEATQPVGTGPYKLAAWNKGVVGDARQMGRFPRPGQDRHRARDVPLHQRPVGGGRGDARRRRRRLPALRRLQNHRRSSRTIRASRC